MRAKRALVVSSGMGALDVITRQLRPGDEVVTGDDLYGGTNRLLKYLSTHGGIIVHHVDTTEPETVRQVLSSKKRTLSESSSPAKPSEDGGLKLMFEFKKAGSWALGTNENC